MLVSMKNCDVENKKSYMLTKNATVATMMWGL